MFEIDQNSNIVALPGQAEYVQLAITGLIEFRCLFQTPKQVRASLPASHDNGVYETKFTGVKYKQGRKGPRLL